MNELGLRGAITFSTVKESDSRLILKLILRKSLLADKERVSSLKKEECMCVSVLLDNFYRYLYPFTIPLDREVLFRLSANLENISLCVSIGTMNKDGQFIPKKSSC
jgi:hypothetical protein